VIQALAALGALLFGAVVYIANYRKLSRLRHKVHDGWAAVETALRHRHDAIASLVEILKTRAPRERDTLQTIAHVRNVAAANHGTPSQRLQTENALSGAAQQLRSICEATSELKTDNQFIQSQSELKAAEKRVAHACHAYNAAVRELNSACTKIPSNVAASLSGFQSVEPFEIEEAAVEPASFKD
jgi:LemA protein